jgi:hypothetical protein
MKKFCKALVDAPMRFFNDSKQTKREEYMELLELEREGLEFYFFKKLNANTIMHHSLPVFSTLLLVCIWI